MTNVQLASGLERTAEEMGSISLIRSITSKEGDHERGTYAMKTGFRPDPTVIHPSIGAIVCHELPVAGSTSPAHQHFVEPMAGPRRLSRRSVQRLSHRRPGQARTRYELADAGPSRRGSAAKSRCDRKRLRGGTEAPPEATLHRDAVAGALKMMSSEQLKAFDVMKEPLVLRRAYGETPFGRGCLAARRLIEVGVRCVEVTLARLGHPCE